MLTDEVDFGQIFGAEGDVVEAGEAEVALVTAADEDTVLHLPDTPVVEPDEESAEEPVAEE